MAKLIRKLSKRGFTLVELMVVILILGLVIGLVYGVFISSKRVQTAEEQLVGLSQEARGGLMQMVRELRMVSAKTALTTVANSCGIANIALSSTAVEFEGDVDLDNTLERIRYFYNSTSKTLHRWEYEIPNASGIHAWPGWCLLSLADVGAPAPTYSETIAYNIDNLNIQYFSAGNAVAADASAVKRVAVTVTAKSSQAPQQTKTLTVDVELRSLGAEGVAGDISAPAPPSNVQAVDRQACGYLGVTWTKGDESDLAGHKIYYKAQLANGTWPGEWGGIKTVGLVESTEFSGLTNGATYMVGVAAYDTSGLLSAVVNSTVAIADTRPPANITGLAGVQNDTEYKVDLSWTASSDTDVEGRLSDDNAQRYGISYYVERATAQGGPFTVIAGPLSPYTNTTALNTGLTGCTNYYYRVKTVDSCGLSNTISSANYHVANIVLTSINPPQTFYAGGGTTVYSDANEKYYYARFSGQHVNDSLLGDLAIEYEKGDETTCPANAVAYRGGSYLVPAAQLSISPSVVNSGESFTGRWPINNGTAAGIQNRKIGGVWKNYKYRFAAYSKNKCGFYSEPLNNPYCVDKCLDSTTTIDGVSLVGAGGLGDACMYGYGGDPLRGYVCDRIKLFWVTKDAGNDPPANCKAGVKSTDDAATRALKDFYPDVGDGGYLMFRTAVDSATVCSYAGIGDYCKLAPDPVTGPIQPFYYEDGFYMGAASDCPTISNTACDYQTASNKACYRDRCSYRYKVRAVDCALNESSDTAEQMMTSRLDSTRPAFSPGVATIPSNTTTYLVEVTGTKKNKVTYWIENTAANTLNLVKAFFDWKDAGAKLTKVEIANSTEAPGITNWRTLWQAEGTSRGVSNATVVSFLSGSYTDWNNVSRTASSFNNATVPMAPLLGAGDTAKAKMLLTFYSTTGSGQRMDDPYLSENELLRVAPYYINNSSTAGRDGPSQDDRSCDGRTLTYPSPCGAGKTGDECMGGFYVQPNPGPTIDTASVRQNPPSDGVTQCSGHAATEGFCAITNSSSAPPNGNYRSYTYDANTVSGRGYYYVDNVDVTVRAKVTPKAGYPVAECGDLTNNNRGAILYYRITPNTVTVGPQPVDGSGNEDLTNPTNYSKIAMCEESSATGCSDSTNGCTYITNSPAAFIPAQTAYRVWYYIAAFDSLGNYNIAPSQPIETFNTAYTYDAKEKAFRYLWLSGISFAGGSQSINQIWLTRVKTASGSDPADASANGTVGSTYTITVTGLNSGTLLPQTETLNATTVSGCSGCYAVETGLSAALSTSATFAAPTVAAPIIITVTVSKAGYTDRTCSWTTENGSTLTTSSICNL